MRKILKFELGHEASIEVPAQSRFLKFQAKDNKFHVWFECSVPGAKMKWIFRIFQTDLAVPQGLDHVASDIDGDKEWHLYERV